MAKVEAKKVDQVCQFCQFMEVFGELMVPTVIWCSNVKSEHHLHVVMRLHTCPQWEAREPYKSGRHRKEAWEDFV